MSLKTQDNSGDTVRLLRPAPRVFTDPRGNSVWMGEVEVVDFELVRAVATDPYNSHNESEAFSTT